MTNKHHLFCSDNLIHNVNIIVIIKNILVGECKTLIESKKKKCYRQILDEQSMHKSHTNCHSSLNIVDI